MIGLELIIKFKKKEAYLTDDMPLTFDVVEIGEVAKVRGFRNSSYWLLRVLDYHADEGQINVEVISYSIGEADFSPFQLSIAADLKKVKRVVFKGIDTYGLLKTISGNQLTTYIPAKVTSERRANERIIQSYNDFENDKITFEPQIIKINETFFVPFKKVSFMNGGITFEKKIKQHKDSIEFTIENQNIVKEFDAIKNYFANVLNTKKIQVSVSVYKTGAQITSKDAISPEIDKIDNETIETVKLRFIQTLPKKIISSDIEKSPVSMEDFFNHYSEAKVPFKTFYSNDQQFLEDLFRVSNSKHYRHLRYLSSKHAHDVMKLRIIPKPFSFIFLITGSQHYHFIWETLETCEATYIWDVEKNLQTPKMAFQKIVALINKIKEQGKTYYISSNDSDFRRIFHIYSENTDGFIKWKGELECLLT